LKKIFVFPTHKQLFPDVSIFDRRYAVDMGEFINVARIGPHSVPP
jgi:hypothetical protein